MKDIAEMVHDLAKQKGWHNDNHTEGQFIERACNNLHDEVSELHEAWRNGLLRKECDKAEAMRNMGMEPLTCLEEELADIVIRVFDNAERLGVDIEDCVQRKHLFNATRSYRHGGKLS